MTLVSDSIAKSCLIRLVVLRIGSHGLTWMAHGSERPVRLTKNSLPTRVNYRSQWKKGGLSHAGKHTGTRPYLAQEKLFASDSTTAIMPRKAICRSLNVRYFSRSLLPA